MFALVTLVAGLALLLTLHVLTPSWRWPATAAALLGAWIAGVWMIHWIETSSLAYTTAMGDYTVQTFAELTLGFAMAVLSYGAMMLRVPADEPVVHGVHA